MLRVGIGGNVDSASDIATPGSDVGGTTYYWHIDLSHRTLHVGARLHIHIPYHQVITRQKDGILKTTNSDITPSSAPKNLSIVTRGRSHAVFTTFRRVLLC